MKELFTLGGELSRRNGIFLGLLGIVLLILGWELIIRFGVFESKYIPGSFAVITSVPEVFGLHLFKNVWYSFKLNLMSYAVALAIAFPLGMVLGLSPLIRGLSAFLLGGLPYLPLSAVTILFIGLFGIGDVMKVSFLTFALIIYLVPVTCQGALETKKVYLNTAQTLGASAMQKVFKVYVPDTFGRVWGSMSVMVGISWTYIIIVELINSNAGGMGSMIFKTDRMHRHDMMFAVLFILMFIGFCQAAMFRIIGNWLFPYKKGS